MTSYGSGWREDAVNQCLELGIQQHETDHGHTPSVAFRHPPPNSARIDYATEGVLFIAAQLSSDAVSALRKVPVLI